jgi:hypothetical protein
MVLTLLLLACLVVWGLNRVAAATQRTAGMGSAVVFGWERQESHLVVTFLGRTFRVWIPPSPPGYGFHLLIPTGSVHELEPAPLRAHHP